MRRPQQRTQQRRHKHNQLLVESPRPQGAGLGVAVFGGAAILGLSAALYMVWNEGGVDSFTNWASSARASNIGPARAPGEIPLLMNSGPKISANTPLPDPKKVGLDDPVNGPANPPSSRAQPFAKTEDEGLSTYLTEGDGMPEKHRQLPSDEDRILRDAGRSSGIASRPELGDDDPSRKAMSDAKERTFARYLHWLSFAESERDRFHSEEVSATSSSGAAVDPERLRKRVERLNQTIESTRPAVPTDCLLLDGYVRSALDQERKALSRAAGALKAGDTQTLAMVRRTLGAGAGSSVQKANLELMRLCRNHKLRATLRIQSPQSYATGLLASAPGVGQLSLPETSEKETASKSSGARPSKPVGVNNVTSGKTAPKGPNPAGGSAVRTGAGGAEGTRAPAGEGS